jgi:hypothetical protein
MYVCDYCSEEFNTREEAIEHLKDNHIEEFFLYYFELWVEENITVDNEFEE